MFYSDENYRRQLRRYSRSDLESARRNIDREIYPQRHFWIEAEIKRRKEGGRASKEEGLDQPAPLADWEYMRTPLNNVRAWGLLLGSCFMVYAGIVLCRKSDIARSDCAVVSGTIDYMRWDSTEHHRRKSLRKYYTYFKVYGLAETEGAFKYDQYDLNHGQVWRDLKVGDEVGLLYRRDEGGYYWNPLEIIQNGDTLVSFDAAIREERGIGFGLIVLGIFLGLVSLSFVVFETDSFIDLIRGRKRPTR